MQIQNKYYWEKKEERAKKAREHNAKMERLFSKETAESVRKTVTYNNAVFPNIETEKNGNITMRVVMKGTVEALLEEEYDGKTALLNFASYKNPGGMFLKGSQAQEECLCHASNLYNVLKEFEHYYSNNRQDVNRGLYRDKALYSPGIIFGKTIENPVTKKPECLKKECDVITCASPNFAAAEHFVSREENNKALRERIRFILNIAKVQNVKNLILGAYGCGVFKQDPETVAKYFVDESKAVFADYDINIIFAVIPPLPNQTDNAMPFKKAVEKWNR